MVQISESTHQSYFEHQQNGENKTWVCTICIININKGDTVDFHMQCQTLSSEQKPFHSLQCGFYSDSSLTVKKFILIENYTVEK